MISFRKIVLCSVCLKRKVEFYPIKEIGEDFKKEFVTKNIIPAKISV